MKSILLFNRRLIKESMPTHAMCFGIMLIGWGIAGIFGKVLTLGDDIAMWEAWLFIFWGFYIILGFCIDRILKYYFKNRVNLYSRIKIARSKDKSE